MAHAAQERAEPALARTGPDRLEGLAFQFCKIATFSLLAGRYALPLASALCCGLFVAAYVNGRRTSRCFLRYPLLIAALWGAASVVSWTLLLRPELRDQIPFWR